MTDLTDRMRTCAAHLIAGQALLADDAKEHAVGDAADLLIEASNALETAPAPLGEPMAIIPPVATTTVVHRPPVPKATWTTNAADLSAVPHAPGAGPTPRTCPSCDSRAHKRVFRNGTELYLACPVCAHAWPYQAQLP